MHVQLEHKFGTRSDLIILKRFVSTDFSDLFQDFIDFSSLFCRKKSHNIANGKPSLSLLVHFCSWRYAIKS